MTGLNVAGMGMRSLSIGCSADRTIGGRDLARIGLGWWRLSRRVNWMRVAWGVAFMSLRSLACRRSPSVARRRDPGPNELAAVISFGVQGVVTSASEGNVVDRGGPSELVRHDVMKLEPATGPARRAIGTCEAAASTIARPDSSAHLAARVAGVCL